MQESLHIRALLVPGYETMNGKRVAQVVNSGFQPSRIGSLNTRMVTQNSEVLVECVRH